MTPRKKNTILLEALTPLYSNIKHTVFFSFFTNLLILSPTWYMLEVYDRVVNSQNYQTLLMLTIMVIGMYAILEALEWARGRIMFSASVKFEGILRERVFNSIFQARLKQISGGTSQALSDLKVIQEAIASPALMALIDLPFAILTLTLIFYINPMLGWFAVCGAIILGIIAAINQYSVQPPLAKANQHAISAQNYANGAIRNAQVIEAMGMLSRIHQKWMQKQHEFLRMQAIASDRAGINSSLSKLTQTLQGSLLLGLGCWLTLKGELSMGGSMMIIASILGGRILAPLVVIVTHWRVIIGAQDAAKRLNEFLSFFPEPKPTMALPPPLGHLSVEAASACPPNSQTPILKGISFKLSAGQSLGIIGPSASGKSTLARIITGIWPTVNGKVRLDGADVYTWKKTELGPHIGYLPQNVELFDGSLAENIARFGEIEMSKVIDASKTVGLDIFISTLKDGYHTQLGNEGAFLSGGQRQRVALARAIYGMPKFLVLDEPNSSLDEEGDVALLRTLEFMKSNGTTLVVITHRSQILSVVDHLIILVDGQVTAIGPRDEILKTLSQQNQITTTPSPTSPTKP
jgi:ATP-binding cassette subfamily C exporter for protease/lipase